MLEGSEVVLASKTTPFEYRRDEGNLQELPEDELETLKSCYLEHERSVEYVESVLGEYASEVSEIKVPAEDLPEADLVVSMGGDGTVLNTHYFLDDTPLLPLNSDPENSNGALTTHEYDELDDMLEETFDTESWTRAEASGEDYSELALNEIFVGGKFNDVPAKYVLTHGDVSERHENSGLVVSTGAGSTAWYGNIEDGESFPKSSGKLCYTAREPMNHSGEELLEGCFEEFIEIVSKMNRPGMISFDGRSNRRRELQRGDTVMVKPAGRDLNVII